MNQTVKQILQFLVFASLGVIILYFLYQSQSSKYLEDCLSKGNAQEDCSLLLKVGGDFRNANWWWLFTILFIYMISNVFRTWRWQMLIRPLGYTPTFKNAFMAIMIGYFANLGVPRLGEVLRAGFYSKYDNVPLEKTLGTIVSDRLVDIVSLFVFLLVTLPFSIGPLGSYINENLNLEDKLHSFNISYLIIGFVVFIAIVALILRSKAFLDSAIFKKVKSMLLGFKDGLISIKNIESVPRFVLYSAGIWLCYYLMTYLTFYAFQPTSHLGPREGLITFIFGTLGILFPSPGGMGSYHFMVMEALSIFNVDSIEGFSFANIVYFAIMVFGNVVFGILSLIFMPILNRK